MKSFLLFTVLTALIALAVCDHASWGARQPGDRLLDSRIQSKKGSFMQVVTQDVNYSGYYNITMINVVDTKKSGKPSLLQGGPGTTSAVIHLKSKRGSGFEFRIEIYGR